MKPLVNKRKSPFHPATILTALAFLSVLQDGERKLKDKLFKKFHKIKLPRSSFSTEYCFRNLIKYGFIEKIANLSDMRKCYYKITPQGLAYYNENKSIKP